MNNPLVSVVVLSWNRRQELARTLGILAKESYRPLEIIVVDNGSADGSARMVQSRFSGVKLIALPDNHGAEARNQALRLARGEYLVMLDDDSAPTPGSLERMVRVFQERPDLGALAFRVLLPGGQEETAGARCAFIGCGVGFRTGLFRRVGGYPKGYVYYAEEYDLSFRILEAGYKIEWYGDIAVRHRKAQGNRRLGRILGLLVRNNLWLWPRYLPPGPAFAECWALTARYLMVGLKEGELAWCLGGLARGLLRLPRALAGRRPLPGPVVEHILGGPELLAAMRGLAEKGARSIGLVGYTRDTRRYLEAARASGLTVTAIHDDLLAGHRRAYRGAPVKRFKSLGRSPADLLVVTATAPGAGLAFKNQAAELGAAEKVIHLFPFAWADAPPPE